MIQANELRLGNFVNFMADDTVFVVDEIVTDGIGVHNAEESSWIEIDQFSGVPLTEEWLLKFGFSKEPDEPFNWSDKKKHIADCFLMGHYSEGIHYVKNGTKIGKPLKYVHQLQNSYRTLSGEELAVND